MRNLYLSLLVCIASWTTKVTGVEWTPVISPGEQIFPALILATANLPERQPRDLLIIGDSNGLIGIHMLAERNQQKVTLNVQMPGWLRESQFHAILPQKGLRYSVFPTLAWDFDKLRNWQRSAPETITFSLTVDNSKPEQKSMRVRLRSINDVPYFIAGKKSSTDLSWMFAAYVDEDHPRVTSIIQEALTSKIVARFDGYQSKNPKTVLKQVYAIWNALQKRGIHYSSITRTGNRPGDIYAQYVRFLDESWLNNQANCVDGSILLASVLRKLDLNPSLVMIPEHMMLAFELTPGGERAYLETTQLDSVLPDANGKLDENASFKSFTKAVQRGYATYQTSASHFGDSKKPEYQIIDIGAARKLGVMPIGGR